MQLNSILLMAGGAKGSDQSPYSGLIMMVLIIAVFYFFFIRPQQKKNKEIQKFRQGLQKGDKVIIAKVNNYLEIWNEENWQKRKEEKWKGK